MPASSIGNTKHHLPDEIVVVKNRIHTLCYTAWRDRRFYGKSVFVYKDMTVVIVLSIFLIIFCIYSVIFYTKMVELRMLAWTDIVSGNVYSIIYVD